MKRLVPWHKIESDNDIGLRLIDDGAFWVDLAICDKNGHAVDLICSFSKAHGHVLRFNAKLVGDYTKAPANNNVTIPFYKVWHNKEKAVCRLRLRTYNELMVVCSTSNKGNTQCHLLMLKTNSTGIITLERNTFIGTSLGLPLDSQFRLYVEE